MAKLISMTDFVRQESSDKKMLGMLNSENNKGFVGFWSNVFGYANFLKQPLETWMFIACDNQGIPYKFDKETGHNAYDRGYQEAEDRVLFKDVERIETKHYCTKQIIYQLNNKRIGIYNEYHNGKIEFDFQLSHDFKTIEDLVCFEFELTPSALRQIGIAQKEIKTEEK